MHLKKLAVRNFRRLRNVVIDLASDISIFVGANNSGKTSVGHALQLFTGSGRFNIHDFSADLWADIVAFGEGDDEASLHERIKPVERRLLIDVVRRIATGDIDLAATADAASD